MRLFMACSHLISLPGCFARRVFKKMGEVPIEIGPSSFAERALKTRQSSRPSSMGKCAGGIADLLSRWLPSSPSHLKPPRSRRAHKGAGRRRKPHDVAFKRSASPSSSSLRKFAISASISRRGKKYSSHCMIRSCAVAETFSPISNSSYSFSPSCSPTNLISMSPSGLSSSQTLKPAISIILRARSTIFTDSPMSRTKTSPPRAIAAACITSCAASGMSMK